MLMENKKVTLDLETEEKWGNEHGIGNRYDR